MQTCKESKLLHITRHSAIYKVTINCNIDWPPLYASNICKRVLAQHTICAVLKDL